MGKRIQKLRLGLGLSQSQLAKKAGVATVTIQAWEHGRRTPLLSAAVPLADALGVSLDELAGRKWPRRR
jgi:transcriptional regulator with XRE-family HTH domain